MAFGLQRGALWVVGALLAHGITAAEPVGLPIRFAAPGDGYVTLVIESADGQRLRNLVADWPCKAGENVVYWDGLVEDELRPVHVPGVAVYSERVPGPVAPAGTYRVRGLYRGALALQYEYTVNTAGNPPWRTPDGRGGWLGDFSPPSAVAALLHARPPQMFLGSHISDWAGDNLIFCDLTGQRLSGIRSHTDGWSGAQVATRDAGLADRDELYYAVVLNDGLTVELRNARTGGGLLKYVFDAPDRAQVEVGGVAAWRGLIALSLPQRNEILFYDVAREDLHGRATVENPRGLAFTPDGQLLVVTGRRLVRFELPAQKDLPISRALEISAVCRATRKLPVIALPEPVVLVGDGLEDPQQVFADGSGMMYVSDWGQSHQVKVFAADGRLVRVIGQPGGVRTGPYDPTRMHRPFGLAVAADGQLWVAERNPCPRRVSIWKPDGTFVKSLFGPTYYGGGGNLDPRDARRMYVLALPGHDGGLMEFAADGRLTRILNLPGQFPHAPQLPLDVNGRRYFVSLYAQGDVKGELLTGIWQWDETQQRLVLVGAVGDARQWPVLAGEEFRERWPRFVNLRDATNHEPALFAWTDRDGDERPGPAEVRMARVSVGAGLTVDRALGITTGSGWYLPVTGWTDGGAPEYDLAARVALMKQSVDFATSGGGQVVRGSNGWVLAMTAVNGRTQTGLTGVKDGVVRWFYPCDTFGLHASVFSKLPAPGALIGITRLLGLPVRLPQAELDVVAINGNKGQVFLVSTDGFYVGALFRDMRQAERWPDTARAGLSLTNASLGEECFHPTINQLADGSVYIVGGQPFSAAIRVTGLETVRRLPDAELTVTPAHAEAAWQRRRAAPGQPVAREPLRVAVGGPYAWVDISPAFEGRAGSGINAPAQARPVLPRVEVAARVAGDKLFVGCRTNLEGVRQNAGGDAKTIFHSGGALDVQLGSAANPGRTQPVAGDVRVVVGLVKGQPVATRYRPVVPGTTEPVVFASWHTVKLDAVDDVSDAVTWTERDGMIEVGIPLAVLGLEPRPGQTLRGDLGVIVGNGVQAVQRIYWSNQINLTVSDIPLEAQVLPAAWGDWRFIAEKTP